MRVSPVDRGNPRDTPVGDGVSRGFATTSPPYRCRDAVARVPGVVAQDVSYNHLQYSSGALSGVVDVDATVTFDDVLRAASAALVEQLGDRADRVIVYLTGRTGDGQTVEPDSLGLPQRPTGTDLRRRYA